MSACAPEATVCSALAVARVQASRALLVRELVAQGQREARRNRAAGVSATAPPRSLAMLALEAIDTASGEHPAAATLHLVCAAALGALAPLAPLARRHPWALVGGAALAGATFVCVPPWRAMCRSAVAGSVMVPLMGRLLPSLLRLALAHQRQQQPR